MDECKCGWHVKRGYRNCPQCGLEVDPLAPQVIFDRPGARLPSRIGPADLNAARPKSRQQRACKNPPRTALPSVSRTGKRRSPPTDSPAIASSPAKQPGAVDAVAMEQASIALKPASAPQLDGRQRLGEAEPRSAFVLMVREAIGEERGVLRSAPFPPPADPFEPGELRQRLDTFRQQVRDGGWKSEQQPKAFQAWYRYRYSRHKLR